MIQPALSQLEAAGLVRSVAGSPDVVYLFRHALVQDATYGTLVRADRRRLHGLVGIMLEQLYPDRRVEMAPVLAAHFLEAGEELRALAYYSLAGKSALAAYANREAAGHYRAGLLLTPDERERADLLAGLAEALVRQSLYAEAAGLWLQAADFYGAAGDTDGATRMMAAAARAAWEAGDAPGGLRLAQQGLDRFAAAPATPGLAALLHEAARAYHFNGLTAAAAPLCRRSLALAQQLGEPATEAEAWTTLALLASTPPGERQAALERAVLLAEGGRLLAVAARAHNNLGVFTDSVQGDPAAARAHYARAADLAGQRGAITQQLFYRNNVIYVALWTGDFVTAAADLREARVLAQLVGPLNAGLRALAITEAALLRYRGDLAAACAQLTAVIVAAQTAGDLTSLSAASTFLGEVALELGDLARAEDALTLAIPIGDQGLGWGPVLPRCLLVALTAQTGRQDMAADLLAAATRAAEGGNDYYALEALALAEARLALASGQPAAAAVAYSTTAAIESRMGLRWYRARTLAEWATCVAPAAAAGLLAEAAALFREIDVPYYVTQMQRQRATNAPSLNVD